MITRIIHGGVIRNGRWRVVCGAGAGATAVAVLGLVGSGWRPSLALLGGALLGGWRHGRIRRSWRRGRRGYLTRGHPLPRVLHAGPHTGADDQVQADHHDAEDEYGQPRLAEITATCEHWGTVTHHQPSRISVNSPGPTTARPSTGFPVIRSTPEAGTTPSPS